MASGRGRLDFLNESDALPGPERQRVDVALCIRRHAEIVREIHADACAILKRLGSISA